MKKRYCEKYDAFYNPETGEWLEEKCDDVKCGYCKDRPKKHIPHKWEFVGGIKGWCGKRAESEENTK